MPVDLIFDHRKHRIVTTVRGPFATEDCLDVLGRMRGNTTWGYGALVDMRQMTGAPTQADLMAIVEAAGRGDGAGTRGPLAVVTLDPDMTRAAAAYAAMPGHHRRVRVFSDFDDAEQWLQSAIDSRVLNQRSTVEPDTP